MGASSCDNREPEVLIPPKPDPTLVESVGIGGLRWSSESSGEGTLHPGRGVFVGRAVWILSGLQ